MVLWLLGGIHHDIIQADVAMKDPLVFDKFVMN